MLGMQGAVVGGPQTPVGVGRAGEAVGLREQWAGAGAQWGRVRAVWHLASSWGQ